MIAIVLFSLASCHRSLSSVITGTWQVSATYSSPPDVLPPFNFSIVQPGKSPNYLSATFRDEPVQINLSFADLSGNISYLGEVYGFLFIERAPPFISTDIDARELGFGHCIIPNFVFARCSFFGPDREISVTLNKQAADANNDWSELWKAGIVVVIGVAAHWLLGEYLTREQVKLNEEVKEKKRKAAEEKAKVEGAPPQPEKEVEEEAEGKLKTD
jgi:hypothetical protein